MMRIAVPLSGSVLAGHFGRATRVYLCDVDPAGRTMHAPRIIARATGGCESFPEWLRRLAVQVVLAHGAGPLAQSHLKTHGIELHLGHACEKPSRVVERYLASSPQAPVANPCEGLPHRHRHCKSKG